MKLDEFRNLSWDYVDHDTYLNFRELLDLSYFSSFGFDEARIIEAFESGKRAPTQLRWLEICFLVDIANGGEMEFYGILPIKFDTTSDGELSQAAVITFGEPLGDVQPLDWETIMLACEATNDELDERAAFPVVRISYDQHRAHSLYYTLKQFNYKEMRVKVGAERAGVNPDRLIQ